MQYLWFLILTFTTTSVICGDTSFNNVSGLFTTVNGSESNQQVFNITSGNTLKDYLPSEPLSTLRIYDNDIPILYEDSVSNLTVGSIYFNYVNLKEIKPGAFRNLTTSTLNLGWNKIETLQEGTFENLPLTYVALRKNNISTIHPQAFKNLTELRDLELNSNRLEKFGMLDLPSLERLDLSLNAITDIEIESSSSFSYVVPKGQNLKYMNLDHNNLTIVKKGAFNLPSLIELYLFNNEIREIELGAFDNLPNLTKLDIGQNKLTTISSGVFKSSHLQELFLRYNDISSIESNSFSELPDLEKLDLSNNRLQDIKEGPFNNLNITFLDLFSNNISSIASTAFDNMTKLERIFLENNSLSTYDPNWFKNDVKLYILVLENNHIKEIPDDAFRNIGNNSESTVLILRENGINNISETAFKSLRKIKLLNLESNRIETWTDSYLNDTESIEDLVLSNNRLKCFQGDLSKIFKPKLTSVERNPLESECEKNITNWLSKNNAFAKVCLSECDSDPFSHISYRYEDVDMYNLQF